MRTGERIGIFTDENGIGGPEAGKRNPKEALSPCIQLGSFIVDTALPTAALTPPSPVNAADAAATTTTVTVTYTAGPAGIDTSPFGIILYSGGQISGHGTVDSNLFGSGGTVTAISGVLELDGSGGGDYLGMRAASRSTGRAGWGKSPCPDLARAWAGKPAQATRQPAAPSVRGCRLDT